MIRSVWLAFVSLVAICALAALKVSIATPSKQQAALADEVLEADVAQDPLPKADKLDEAPDKKTVQAIAIVPPQAAPTPQEKTTKVVRRQWRESYAKVKKRKHYRHHATRTRKHRRAHR